MFRMVPCKQVVGVLGAKQSGELGRGFMAQDRNIKNSNFTLTVQLVRRMRHLLNVSEVAFSAWNKYAASRSARWATTRRVLS